MGSSRFVKAAPVRVDIGGGDWVELKPYTKSDRDAIEAAGFRFTATAEHFGKGGKEVRVGAMEGRFDTVASTVESFKRAVVAWGGPGFCEGTHDDDTLHQDTGRSGCRIRPINAENLNQLDDATVELLSESINELNPKPADREDPSPNR